MIERSEVKRYSNNEIPWRWRMNADVKFVLADEYESLEVRVRELEAALEPFVKFCSSEDKITLVVSTEHVRNARFALAWDARALLKQEG